MSTGAATAVEMAWDAATLGMSVPWSNPMAPVLALCGLQVAMGAFDNIYHHELRERLPWTSTASTEQGIHSVRGALYAGVFASLAGLTPTGAGAYALAGVLVAETCLTLYDFVVEDATRWRHRSRLPPTERVTHTLMTLNYGAVLSLWLPVMLGPGGWAAAETGLAFTNYGIMSAVNAIAAVGVGAWAVRDHLAVKRLRRFAALPPLQLGLQPPPVRAGQAPRATHRVLITGGTGMLGGRLVAALLREGHAVTLLARSREAAVRHLEAAGAVGGCLTIVESLDDVDVSDAAFDTAINLAGAPLAEGRWTEERRRELFASRVGVTERLVDLIAALPPERRPQVLLSASAIGVYGVEHPPPPSDVEATKAYASRDVTEATPPTETDSLSQRLCADWERAALRAVDMDLGVRVVLPRIGIVLGRDGGVMSRMLTPFEFGLGGAFGSGRQWMPWIHVDDLMALMVRCIDDASLAGPVNAVAPQPVTNAQLTAALGRALRRPTVMAVPAAPLRALMGPEVADELILSGRRVVASPKLLAPLSPEAGSAAGADAAGRPRFRFAYDTIDAAMLEVAKGVARPRPGAAHDAQQAPAP